jgi:hypothetical protein
VRENVQVKRTAYRVECRTETYDAFRCERVPVTKEIVVKKQVPVWTEEVRRVCHKETVYEDRVVNKTSYKYVQETCMKKELVRLGHWECREVTPLFGGGHGGLFGHGNKGCCNDPCGNNNGCNDACRPARTRKVWVHCPEYRECPQTVCKKVCVTEAVKCRVAVCKDVWKEEKCKVCKMTCVEEKCKVTVCETRQVPCKATRTVRTCVPYEETVNCCKWVQKTVTRQVPCAPACQPASNACCERASLFDRFHRDRGCCEQKRSCGNHRSNGCCN